MSNRRTIAFYTRVLTERLRLLCYVFLGPALAVRDALRAWNIAPNFFALCNYRTDAGGVHHVVFWRPWSPLERIQIKAVQAGRVFLESLRVRVAEEVSIRRLGTEGFCANLLHVLEVLHRIRPNAQVHVDWALDGNESGFRYGVVGENVWQQLFCSLGPRPTGRFVVAQGPVDLAFWGNGKVRLTGRALQNNRASYHQTFRSWIQVNNPRVNVEVERMSERLLRHPVRIGVHRRVPNWMVANLQSHGTVPSISQFLECVRRQIYSSGAHNWVIFLATDDAQAVPAFMSSFGDRLLVRSEVKRTRRNQTEVHFHDWGKLSIADAEDVFIDTLLLARCTVLIHTSSSISTVASLINPAMTLVEVPPLRCRTGSPPVQDTAFAKRTSDLK